MAVFIHITVAVGIRPACFGKQLACALRVIRGRMHFSAAKRQVWRKRPGCGNAVAHQLHSGKSFLVEAHNNGAPYAFILQGRCVKIKGCQKRARGIGAAGFISRAVFKKRQRSIRQALRGVNFAVLQRQCQRVAVGNAADDNSVRFRHAAVVSGVFNQHNFFRRQAFYHKWACAAYFGIVAGAAAHVNNAAVGVAQVVNQHRHFGGRCNGYGLSFGGNARYF